MDYAAILAELRTRRDQIDAAIRAVEALDAISNGGRSSQSREPGKRERRKPGRITEEVWEKAVARCLKGEKVSAVARDIGVSYSPLYTRVKEAQKKKLKVPA